MKNVIRAISLSIVLRGLRLLLNVGLVGLLGRHLGVANMGLLFSAQATVAILLCVAELGFARITVRELARHPEKTPEILGAAMVARLVAGLILFAAMLAVVFSLDLSPAERWILSTQALLLPTHCLSELGAWIEARGKVAETWKSQFIGFLCGALLVVLGVWAGASAPFFVVPYLVECWVVSVLLWHQFVRAGCRLRDLKLTPGMLPRLIRESWPELLTQLATLSLFRIDTVMLKLLLGATAAGTYGAAVRLSEILYFLPAALAGVMGPRLFAQRPASAPGAQADFTNYYTGSWLMSLAGAAAVSFVSWPLTTGLLGGEFASAAAVLQVHAWAFIPYALGVARTQHLVASGKVWLNLPSVGAALVVNVILNWLWIPRWGAEGAAWATLISYTVAWQASSILLPQLRESARLQWAGLAGVPALVQRLVLAAADFRAPAKSKNR